MGMRKRKKSLRYQHTVMSKIVIAVGLVLGSSANIIQTRKESANFLRGKRSEISNAGIFDPDTWCNDQLTAPKCWEDWAENVWQPFRPWNNLVEKSEGKDLAYCVKKCSMGDWFKDFVGTAYEEKREVREEYQDMVLDSGNKGGIVVGCAHCCKYIPESLQYLQKVQNACFSPSDSSKRRNNGRNNN